MTELEEHTFTYGDEKTTFYLAAGPTDGPLIILCHGWPAIGKTWKQQLEAFSLLGFRTIAPDMPGYGRSTARKVAEDYSMERVNDGMLALLQHLKRDKAIWIGHDWGSPAVWSFAAHYPEKTMAVAGIAVPYGVLELGLEEVVKTVNRERYPEDQYPYGHWDYQRFYETDFEKITAWYESDARAFLRAGFRKSSPEAMSKPAITSSVCKDGGWFGGIATPDPEWRRIPAEDLCIDERILEELTQAMEKTGFWGADAWYSNHKRNRAYFFGKAKNGGRLEMPVLFIQAQYDAVCDSVNSTFAEPQRKLCKNLTEVSIPAGHWVPQEKPGETSAAIIRWLVESVPEHWPVQWSGSPAKIA